MREVEVLEEVEVLVDVAVKAVKAGIMGALHSVFIYTMMRLLMH